MTPEYLICLECESPVYLFEWQDGKVTEGMCPTCGNDDVNEFATEDEFDALASGDH